MNVFNVHVNRAPLPGVISKLSYRPGKFLNASLDKASVDNERQSLRLTIDKAADDEERDIAFVQIAGLVARQRYPPLSQMSRYAAPSAFVAARCRSAF